VNECASSAGCSAFTPMAKELSSRPNCRSDNLPRLSIARAHVLLTAPRKIVGNCGGEQSPESAADKDQADYIRRLGIGFFPQPSASDGASPYYKMQDQRDYGEHE
jgi:hypothetical protein